MVNKVLKFRDYLVEPILSRKKDITWRFFDEKNISAGDEIDLINWNTKEKFGEAIVTDVWEKIMGELEAKDFEGHEKFNNKEEMYDKYRVYYGNRINEDTIVKIIHFKLKAAT